MAFLKPTFWLAADVVNASSEAELFGYVMLASDHYKVPISLGQEYLDMANDINLQLAHMKAGSQQHRNNLSMFRLLLSAHDRFMEFHTDERDF